MRLTRISHQFFDVALGGSSSLVPIDVDTFPAPREGLWMDEANKGPVFRGFTD